MARSPQAAMPAVVVFDEAGFPGALTVAVAALCPGGCVVLVAMQGAPMPLDGVAAQFKESRLETVFRHVHVFPRALALMGSGRMNVRPLVTIRYDFVDSVAAFDYASDPKSTSVKVQIELA